MPPYLPRRCRLVGRRLNPTLCIRQDLGCHVHSDRAARKRWRVAKRPRPASATGIRPPSKSFYEIGLLTLTSFLNFNSATAIENGVVIARDLKTSHCLNSVTAPPKKSSTCTTHGAAWSYEYRSVGEARRKEARRGGKECDR